MKIVYRITEQDYMEARDLFVANEPWYRRRSRWLMPWVGGLLIALQVLYIITVPDRNPAIPAFGFLIGIYLLYCGFAIRRYFRRLYRNDKRFQHDFTAEISEDGIHIVTPNAETQMKWSNFIRILESDTIFMLFHAEWIFNIFPKRAFDPSEVPQFRDMAQRNISPRT